MILEENWSISPERIRHFLLAQPDIVQTEEDFQYHSCRISLIPVQGNLMGKWPHTRTILHIEGSDTDVQEIHRRIFLQFLSAGG